MLNLGQLAATVQKNCDISDAQYAGDYSLCIFLLKMREFYRWEHQLPLSGPLPREPVGRWMQEREQMWERLEAIPFEPVQLAGENLDPFDTATINRALLPQGAVYSAGIGRFGKPHFFLGRLDHTEQHGDVTVHIANCEYARDLVAPPAMMLDSTVFLRQESMRRMVWEQIEEWRLNHQGNEAMTRALTGVDFARDTEAVLDRFTVIASRIALWHEVGEARAEMLLGEDWSRLLAAVTRQKAEYLLRAVRDLLADCLSTLPGLLHEPDDAALHYFFAGFSGLRRHLAPDAMQAYQQWAAHGDRRGLEHYAAAGATLWLNTAQQLLDLYNRHGDAAGPRIEALLQHAVTCPIQPVHS
jgi:hypothetical protein